MTTIPRRSAKQPTYTQEDLKRAFETIEDRPRIPQKTPSAGDDGYDGEVCRDATRLYVYTDDAWKYVSLTLLT